MLNKRILCLSGFLLLSLLSSRVSAVEAGISDTLFFELDPVNVTAERARASQSTLTLATAVLDEDLIASMPVTNLASAITLSPGFLMVQRDGLGWQPEIIVRGFYGGGEVDYVQLLLDGQPLNAVENGLVNWLGAPLEGIRAIEVVRGGLGALYGDAAIGGVINLITDKRQQQKTGIGVSLGSYGQSDLYVHQKNVIRGNRYSLLATIQNVDGYRDHSSGRNVKASGFLEVYRSSYTTVGFNTNHYWQDLEEPGPIPSDSLRPNRAASEPVYRADRLKEEAHQLGLQLAHRLSQRHRFTMDIWLDRRSRDRVRTLPILALSLSPDNWLRLMDTQNRQTSSGRYQVNIQVTGVERLGNIPSRWVSGLDLSLASLDNRYYDI